MSGDFELLKPYKESTLDTLIRLGVLPAGAEQIKGQPIEKALINYGVSVLAQAAEFMPNDTVQNAIAAGKIVKQADIEKKAQDAAKAQRETTPYPPNWLNQNDFEEHYRKLRNDYERQMFHDRYKHLVSKRQSK